jgi:hypothetical protein
VIGSILALIIVFGTWFTTDAGFNYVVQNTMTGNVVVYSEPGFHPKMPFFTRISAYKQAATINFSGNAVTEADPGTYTRAQGAVTVTFADTYSGDIPATFRFRLPRDTESMMQIHSEFRSFDNLVDSLLTKTARDVIVITSTQYTGEEFFQGGVNQYKVQLVDQLQNGIYETQREQVTIEDISMVPVSSTQTDANELEETQRRVWKNVIQLDNNGDALRLDSPLTEYNINATQVTIGRPTPDDRLDALLDNKRELVGTRISAIEELQTAEAQAQAIQQREEIEKRRQVQVAQRERELAVIAQQQQVDVAREIARREQVEREAVRNLAVIDKDRELAVAVANRDIQAAAAEAAEFEAQAILSIGIADAQVLQAQLEAKQAARDIYMAEIQRDIAEVMYPALDGVTIDMPDFYMGGGEGGSPLNSLDVFTTLGALDQIQSRAAQTTPAN